MTVLLETDRVVLRQFTPDDLDLLVELDNDPDVMRYINNGQPVERAEVDDVLQHWLGYYERSDAYGFWAAIEKRSGDFLGWFHFRPRPEDPPLEPELGYRLHRRAWGHGFGTEVSRALVDKGFAESGVERVHAETMAVHTASRRVMEKSGLQFVRSFRSEWPVPIPGDEHGDVTYAIDRIAWDRARDSAVTTPAAGTRRDIATVLDLIVRQQQRPERNIPSLGFERAGVLAELEEFEPTWTDTLRVVRSADGLVVGAVVTEWDAEVSRAWIHGPWIDVDDAEWQVVAESLVASARAQIPIDITTSVLSGDVTHQCLADLAGRCGWVAGEVNHTLAVDSESVVRWPSTPGAVELCSADSSDSAAIRELHETEFPGAYYSAGQLVDRAVNGDHVVLIAGRGRDGRDGGRDGRDGGRDGRDGGVDGYVAGRIQPDGEGYIDFLAVDPRARRAQIGRNLVMALTRRLMPMSTTQRVCLTVQDRRKPARAMYQSLGFTVDGSIVGYTRDETGT